MFVNNVTRLLVEIFTVKRYSATLIGCNIGQNSASVLTRALEFCIGESICLVNLSRFSFRDPVNLV